ncbi:MAG: FAD-dependent oxidoreductase [Chitinivibrionales bacterium]|nr:FAD-dependent oxidoreductase [Chitinivibrionales bacterium]
MAQDIVIIGGGLGGLAAGVRLAQAGRGVVLYERQPRTGGYATDFTRNGYTFDPALHAVPEGGPGGCFNELTGRLGIDDDVSFVKVPHAFQTVLGEERYTAPNDPDAGFEWLASLSPQDRDGLLRLRRDIERYAPLYDGLVEGRLSPWQIATRFVPRLPLFLHHTDLGVDRYLSRLVRSPLVKALLFQPAVFYGYPMREFSTVNYIVMLSMLKLGGLYTIRGGGRALSDALRRRLVALGGDVRCGVAVEKVLVRGGRAVGVRLAGGAEREASAVIANVNTRALVHELVGDEHFPRGYVRALDTLGNSLSVVQLHVGLECPLEQVGIDRYLTTVFPDSDIDGCMVRQRQSRFLEGCSITAPGVADPRAVGPRGPTLSVVGAVDPAQWLSLSPDEYREAKEECTEKTLALLEGVYPGVRSHCVTVDLATPHTFHRYTGNPDGAIMGFASHIGAHRPLLKISRMPIRGLHLASAWTLRFGGMMQAMRAGVAAAEKVLNQGRG